MSLLSLDDLVHRLKVPLEVIGTAIARAQVKLTSPGSSFNVSHGEIQIETQGGTAGAAVGTVTTTGEDSTYGTEIHLGSDFDDLPEIEVIENHALSPFWRSDQNYQPRPPTRAELEAARRRSEPQPRRPIKAVCLGARPRASRGKAVKQRGSRRTTSTRAGPSSDDDPPGESELAVRGRCERS